MQCFNCEKNSSIVIDSRSQRGGLVRFRRRRCNECGTTWSTWESRYRPKALELTPHMARLDLRSIRRRAGLTQAEMALQNGCSVSTISKVECGYRPLSGKFWRMYEQLGTQGGIPSA